MLGGMHAERDAGYRPTIQHRVSDSYRQGWYTRGLGRIGRPAFPMEGGGPDQNRPNYLWANYRMGWNNMQPTDGKYPY